MSAGGTPGELAYVLCPKLSLHFRRRTAGYGGLDLATDQPHRIEVLLDVSFTHQPANAAGEDDTDGNAEERENGDQTHVGSVECRKSHPKRNRAAPSKNSHKGPRANSRECFRCTDHLAVGAFRDA